jgi:HSP20 family protein
MSRNSISLIDPFRVFSDDIFGSPVFSGNFPINLSEDANSVLVEVEVPGYTRGQIKIRIEDSVLYISAESSSTKEEGKEGHKYYRKEIRRGSFDTSVVLPTRVVAEDAKAKINDGVLSVTLPKAPDVTSKNIEIGVE